MCAYSVAQSFPTFCDHMDCNLPGSSVHGIFQAKIPEWVAISYSLGPSGPRGRARVCWVFCSGRWMRCRCSPVLLVQSLIHGRPFATPWPAARQAPLSFTVSKSLLKLMSVESVMPCSYLILCRPLLLLPSFPASGNEFQWAGSWHIGASVLPINIPGWFPLGLAGLISLQSKGLSRVFSSSTIWKHQFFSAQPSFWCNSHICMWRLEKP